MAEPPRIVVRDAAEWAAWLDEHHETASEVWLVYWKKSTGKTSIVWAEAVEVALRFGWIDGLIRSIDDERYMQRWTPRRPKSKWSQVNKEIALRLIATGEMTPMGLAAVEAAKRERRVGARVHRAAADAGPGRPEGRDQGEPRGEGAPATGSSRTRWDRWLAWLDGSEGRTRTRRINLIVKALETRDYAAGRRAGSAQVVGARAASSSDRSRDQVARGGRVVHAVGEAHQGQLAVHAQVAACTCRARSSSMCHVSTYCERCADASRATDARIALTTGKLCLKPGPSGIGSPSQTTWDARRR